MPENRTRLFLLTFSFFVLCIFLVVSQFLILNCYFNHNKTFDYERVVKLSGKTVFISDLHINSRHLSQYGAISVNLQEDTKTLIMVGDTFHKEDVFNLMNDNPGSLPGTSFCKALTFISNVPKDVYFLYGEGHDPDFLSTSDFKNYFMLCDDQTRIHLIGEEAVFEVDGVKIIAHHGHWIAGGVADCVVSYFAKQLGQPLVLERLWKKEMGVSDDYWLITGHSHVPAIDYKDKIANSGGWIEIPIIGGDLGNVIIIENGTVRLQKLE